ncbi:MAG: hypothetical protein K2L76_03355 [Muribaculaceae bacterium]|nr:hypothetical protein [Muribaculaceae bacterium]
MNQRFSRALFVEYVESEVAALRSDLLTSTAANSLLTSMRAHGYTEITKDSLRMWIVDMTLNNLKISTRKKYFSRVHTIYRGWKSVPGENPFEAVKDAISFDFQCTDKEANANLGLLDRIVGPSKKEVDKECNNLFLYLFYNPMATMGDVINLKFDDYNVDCPQIDEIIEEQKEISRRSTNVFGLGRGRKREPQIMRDTLSELGSIAKLAGMRFTGTFSRDSIIAMWIAAALKAAVPVADIRAVISSVPAEYSSLCLVPVVPISDARKSEIIRQVADSVNNKPRQWFVMKMRSGQTPEAIKDRIKATTDGLLDTMLFYYPTHTVLRKNAKGKSVRKEVPYLPGILFFKICRNKVPLLMSRIGELAWCYKYTNAIDRDYCTISRNEMKAFQHSIGEFTPDIEMGLEVREEPLGEGTVVKINGGGRMVGMEAKIESVKNINGTRTYTLSLTNYLQAKWTVKDVEEIYIAPVEHGVEVS